MDQNRRLYDNIRKVFGAMPMSICQGIVTETDGITCSCRFGSMEVSGIRLRASLTGRDRQMLVVPQKGSAVILGSLSGDLSDLVVLQVDEIERIEINGGQLGGLINIEALTEKINDLVRAFNSHTHSIPSGGVAVSGPAGAASNAQPVSVPAIADKADGFDKSDYEDTKVKH